MLVLNGILSLAVLLIVLVRVEDSLQWTIFQGIVLCGWIGFELILLAEVNVVESVYLLIGSVLLGSGVILTTKKAGE